MTPILNTEQLVLRGWSKNDFPLYASFKAGAEKNRYSIGGVADRVRAWSAFSAMCREWVLRNYGMFAVQKQNEPTAIGYAGIWFPPDIEEPERMGAVKENETVLRGEPRLVFRHI